MRRVLLFDVDGTLLDAAGAGRAALQAALLDVYGTAGPIDDFPFEGRTDPEIARGLLVAAGVPGASIEERFGSLWAAYGARLDDALAERRGRVLARPGVSELLALLVREGAFAIGLLTGNIEVGARRKLDAAGLGDFFGFGAFGSDSEQRDDLPRIALDRARVATGVSFAAQEAVVIGDTPRDIACARAGGTRVLAVATGRFSEAELAAHGPDWTLSSLADATAVAGLLGA